MLDTIPTIMHAVCIDNHALHVITKPVPTPSADEVLIRVDAAGVNRADLFQVQGTYPFPNEADGVLGLEVAGVVVACGANANQWMLGSRVCGIVDAGGYAEYAVAKATHLLEVPEHMTMSEAASLPEALATVWLSLFMHAHVQPHETALIHGGSSGIGVMAIQMLRRYGTKVFATAGNAEKCTACAALGAEAIAYREEDFVAHIKQATDAKGVDVILDMVGGEYVERNIRCLGLNGRMVSIAFLNGAAIHANMAGLLMKDASWRGTRLRAQSIQTKVTIIEQLQQWVWPDVVASHIHPVIDKVFALQEAEKAHKHMQQGLHIGKIVLNMNHFPNR